MEGLDKETADFFKSGGQTEVSDEAPPETEPEDEPVAEIHEPPKQEVPPEKKKPSKFDYQPDTDNVVDDLGRKYIPLGAVQEERKENKRLRAEMEELKTKWTGGEAKLNALITKLQPKEELPAYSEKPLEHLKAKNDALEKNIQEIRAADEKRGKETEQQTQLRNFESQVVASERAFSAKQTDYGEAVSKVQEMWRGELEEAGLEPEQVENALLSRGRMFSYEAMKRNQNPAEAIYKLAQRFGHKAEKKEENKDKDKLRQIAHGQEAEKSLATGKSGGEMSLEALATMSEDELDSFVADPKNWAKISKAA